uniref:Fibronectin type-III domain-containing protein n=1 Tax=Parastrongyloides trichosuri TaxID=131310 RepID=A0A0N4Z2A4_PARTI
MKFFIFLNSIILLVSSIQLDSADLLSAKCQSKCFRNFELRYINDNIMRKKLKHNIGNECREDFKCNSCILPCKESFEDENDCVLKTCTDAGDKGSCYESCRFIYNSTLTKVGLCPNDKKGKSILVNECSAACSNDGDCPDIQKCCTIGCSRICKKPKIKDIRLLPIPESISVQERKRKRSAVVRWVMKKLIPSHVNTNANMYVIQWRWGIQDDIEKMTGWQTITMKTKNYAILKHVLLPGRYYIFRIAAVNEFGTAGFSNSSNPFKLSKEAKAPNSPTNVTYEVVNFNNYLNEWKYRISWLPPHSDLPVKEYHLSYWESDKMTADMLNSKLVNTQIKRSLGQAILEEEDDDNINENIKKVLILPSYSTKAEIEGLKSNKYYIVELYSTAESNNGLLKGDPAYIVIETNNKNEILTNNNDIKKNDVITYNPYHKPIYQKKINFKAAITAPYFHSGSLHSAVSWENHKLCSPIKRNFSVKVYSKSCQGEDIKGRTNECVYVFGGLKFDCEYIIEVNDENTEVNLFTNTFYTYSCVETNGMNEELCQSYEKSGIICTQLSSTIITCSWPQQTMSISSETLIGYRINLSSRNSPSNLTILPPNQRNVIFKDLSPNTDYLLRIQTVTSQGLGQTYETIFRTSKEEIKNDLPTILELPLESTASSNNFRILILLITLSLVPLIRAIIFI